MSKEISYSAVVYRKEKSKQIFGGELN